MENKSSTIRPNKWQNKVQISEVQAEEFITSFNNMTNRNYKIVIIFDYEV